MLTAKRMQQPAELLLYSWNTQASFFDEQSSDILQDIDSRIGANVQLIAVALQEAVKPGSQFISLILPNHLRTKGFEQLRRSRLMGVGITTYKSLQQFDLRLRGLRLALFIRRSWLGEHPLPEVEEQFCYCSGVYQWSLGKGALAFSLTLPEFGRIKFVNLHLPFSAASLNSQDDSVRQAAIDVQTQAVNDIWQQIVNTSPTDHLFLIGDFNYRVRLWNGETVENLDLNNHGELYSKRDELLAELKREPPVLPTLMEGIEGGGPKFAPTAKLLRGSRGEYNFGKQNRRAPSWCDRILYVANPKLNCLSYERLDPNLATSDSDHAAIVGRFSIAHQQS